MVGYVYILKSLRNNRFYIGSTDDIKRRFHEHNEGKSVYTSESRPWKLVFSQKFDNLKLARQIEIKLKKLKSRVILEKIAASGKILLSGKGTVNW